MCSFILVELAVVLDNIYNMARFGSVDGSYACCRSSAKNVANSDDVGSLSIRSLRTQIVFSHVTCVFYSIIYIVSHDGVLNCGTSCSEQYVHRYAEPCVCAHNPYRYRLDCISRVD